LLRVGFSVLGGDCFGGDVEIIYKRKTSLLHVEITTNYNKEKHEFHSKSGNIKLILSCVITIYDILMSLLRVDKNAELIWGLYVSGILCYLILSTTFHEIYCKSHKAHNRLMVTVEDSLQQNTQRQILCSHGVLYQ